MDTGTTPPQDEHYELRPEAGSEGSNTDLEKDASPERDSNLSQMPTEDREEYVVTAKTWAVVVVSCPFVVMSSNPSLIIL